MKVVHHGVFCVDENLILHSKNVQKPFLRSLWIRLYVFYSLCLPTEGPVLRATRKVGTRSRTVSFRSHHFVSEPESFLEVFLARPIASDAGLNPRTASVVPWDEQHQVHVLFQSGTRLQLM